MLLTLSNWLGTPQKTADIVTGQNHCIDKVQQLSETYSEVFVYHASSVSGTPGSYNITHGNTSSVPGTPGSYNITHMATLHRCRVHQDPTILHTWQHFRRGSTLGQGGQLPPQTSALPPQIFLVAPANLHC